MTHTAQDPDSLFWCHTVMFSSVYFRIPTKHKILYQEYKDRKRRP